MSWRYGFVYFTWYSLCWRVWATEGMGPRADGHSEGAITFVPTRVTQAVDTRPLVSIHWWVSAWLMLLGRHGWCQTTAAMVMGAGGGGGGGRGRWLSWMRAWAPGLTWRVRGEYRAVDEGWVGGWDRTESHLPVCIRLQPRAIWPWHTQPTPRHASLL